MSSRELVLRTLEFRTPDRIAVAKGDAADIVIVSYRPVADLQPQTPGMDEWGCVWRSLRPDRGDKGQVVEHPLRDWKRFATYRFPDALAPGRMEHLPAQVTALREAGRFVCGNLGSGPMHLLDYLRGFENYLTDLACRPLRIEALLDGIFGFLEGMVQRYARHGVDGIFMFDDQAMQSGPIFSMGLWRRHFRPRYARLFDTAHRQGLKVCLHSCGNLRDHLVELCEVGVDLLDNKQPASWMHCPAVNQVRGRMAFSTCLDIQGVLQGISLDEIPQAVGELVRRLATPEGGFVATYYHQADLGIPQEKTERMMAAFRAFRWP